MSTVVSVALDMGFGGSGHGWRTGHRRMTTTAKFGKLTSIAVSAHMTRSLGALVREARSRAAPLQ
eukprot:9925934-Lingulodinium_polyedra.AAC.1